MMKRKFLPPESTIVMSGAGIYSFSEIPEKLSKSKHAGLKAEGNKISKIEEKDLENHGDIEYLDVSKNEIGSLEFLPLLKKLTIFLGNSNFVKTLEFIDLCPSLQSVDLSENKISNVALKKTMKSLKFLDLSDNSIKNLGFGNAFPQLNTIFLNSNYVSDISGIQTFPKLQELQISRNHITNFDPFPYIYLTSLDISFNNITNLNCFSQFKALTSLNLSGNPITDEGLDTESSLPKLVSLNLSYTKVSKPTKINKFAPKLASIDLKYSAVSEERELIRFISGASSLVSIDLRCTPLSCSYEPELNVVDSFQSIEEFDKMYPNHSRERQQFRKRVINAAISPLEFINGIRITNKEISTINSIESDDKSSDESDEEIDERKKRMIVLEQRNSELRNEILKLMFADESKPISDNEKKEILYKLKQENERMKKLLSRQKREQADLKMCKVQSLSVHLDYKEKEKTKVQATTQTSQVDLTQKKTSDNDLLQKQTTKSSSPKKLPINDSHVKEIQQRKMKIDDDYEKRKNFLLNCFSKEGKEKSLSELETYNEELTEELERLKSSIKMPGKNQKTERKIHVDEIEKMLKDNKRMIRNLYETTSEVYNQPHRHKHVHHHSHKVTKTANTKFMKHHHFLEYQYPYTSSDSSFDESPVIEEINKNRKRDEMTRNYVYSKISKSETTKSKTPQPKIKRKERVFICRKDIHFTPSLDKAQSKLDSPLKIKTVNEVGGWKNYDKMRFGYWESISTLCSESSLPEYEIPEKKLKPSYPFTEKTPRNIPWDNEKKNVPETRQNKDPINKRRLTFERCEDILLDNARVDTMSAIGKPASPQEKVEFNSKEFEYVRFWVSCVCSHEVFFDEVIKSHSTQKFNALLRSAKGRLTLALKRVDDPSVALNTKVKNNSVFIREKAKKGSYVLCAVDLGKIAVNKHHECYPSSELMQKIKGHGFDSIVYCNRGSEFICVCDGSKVVPLYSFTII